jgi:hypothetical protein
MKKEIMRKIAIINSRILTIFCPSVGGQNGINIHNGNIISVVDSSQANEKEKYRLNFFS